jgi:uncharacterized paraquat-inducible protein A
MNRTCAHCRAAMPVGASVCHRCGKHVAEKPDKRLSPLTSGGFILWLVAGLIYFVTVWAGVFDRQTGTILAVGTAVVGAVCMIAGQKR